MRCSGTILLLVIIAGILSAGCTSLSGTGTAATTVPAATPPPATIATPVPTTAETTVPVPETTSTPVEIATIVHQISLTKDVKDSQLLFSLQVPVEWSLSTRRIENPENFIGEMYQTDLQKNNTFYIHTFTNYRSREQNYRDECKRWVPAPVATVVTINGITFDRFESTSGGRTNVTYVMRQSGMNERGYLSVLAFTTDNRNPFEKEDFDKVVSTFRYYPIDKAGTMPGTEITRIAPDEGEAGNMRSASGRASSPSGSSSSSSSSGSSCRR